MKTKARSSIGSGRQPLTLEGRVRFPHGSLDHDQVVELADTRRSERRAARHGSSTLPLVTDVDGPGRQTQVSQCSAGPHKPGPPGATPGPAICKHDIHGRVRKQAKRRGREPRDFVGSTPTSATRDPVVQRSRRLADIQERDGSTPSGITCWSVSVIRPHASSVRRKAGFDSRTDLWRTNDTGCWSNGTTPGLQPGNRGSIPRRSTATTGSWSNGTTPALAWLEIRVRFPVGPLTTWKVAGYGWPGRFAKPCDPRVMWVQIPCLPLRASIVKWIITSRF